MRVLEPALLSMLGLALIAASCGATWLRLREGYAEIGNVELHYVEAADGQVPAAAGEVAS